VLETLNSQSRAVKQLVRDTGAFFQALTESDGQLASLITNSNTVFGTTAQRDQEIKETFTALPTFIDESNKTLRALEAYANNTNPLVTELQPWARVASKTLVDVKGLVPPFNRLMQGLGPAVDASAKGFPAGVQFLDGLRPLLGQLDPFLRNLNPFFRQLSLYRNELTAFFANITAALGYNDKPGTDVRALRLSIPANPESLASYPHRIGPNRANPYFLPGAYRLLAQGLELFNPTNCSAGGYPVMEPPNANFSEDLRNRIFKYIYQSSQSGIAPPCKKAGKSYTGTDFPQVREDPQP
jgi:ABC-type transporter Mla subunit MlaD